MVKSRRRANRLARNTDSSDNPPRSGKPGTKASEETIKAAEHVALAAFGSGLRLAAALGTVAAKTASLALVSLATGADTFSELVKKEALGPTSPTAKSNMNRTRRRAKRQK